MKIKLSALFVTYYCLLCIKRINANFNVNKFERKLIALEKVLKYMIERPMQMNMDAALGVTFVETNIYAALQHANVELLDNYQQNFLSTILQLSEDTRQKILAHETYSNANYKKLSLQLNQPEIWVKPIIWRHLNLTKKLLPHSNLTSEKTLQLMYIGHPQEHESDFCFIKLVHNCQFPNKCRDLITRNEDSKTGYPLTHRLLMLQIMTAQHCQTAITQFIPHLNFKFCSLILQDLINLEDVDFLYSGKDLASEEVFLCGMEGYLEFLDDHYEQLILDWQHPSGCYSGMGYNVVARKIRARRLAEFTDYGCVNHATGLGAANLALMLRKDIELFD